MAIRGLNLSGRLGGGQSEPRSSAAMNNLLGEISKRQRWIDSGEITDEVREQLQGQITSLMGSLTQEEEALREQIPNSGWKRLLGGAMSTVEVLSLPFNFVSRNVTGAAFNASIAVIKGVGLDQDDRISYQSLGLNPNKLPGAGERVQQIENELGVEGGNDPISIFGTELSPFGIDITPNRLFGGIGDIITDPSTFMGGTSIKAANGATIGRRMSRSAQIAHLGQSSPEWAARATARRSMADVPASVLRDANISRGFDIGIGRTRNITLGGSEIIRAGQRAGGALSRGVRGERLVTNAATKAKHSGGTSRFISRNRAARAIVEGRTSAKRFDVARRFDMGEATIDEFVQVTTMLSRKADVNSLAAHNVNRFNNIFQKSIAKTAGSGRDQARLLDNYAAAGREIHDFLENPFRVVAAMEGKADGAPIMVSTSAGELDVRPFVEFYSATRHDLNNSIGGPLLGAEGKSFGLTGENGDLWIGYVPRASDNLEEFRKLPGSDALEKAARERTLVPDEYLNGVKLEDEGLRTGTEVATNTVSRAQIREILEGAQRPDTLPWSDDVVAQLNNYISSIGMYRATDDVAKKMINEAMGLPIDPRRTAPFILSPDKPFTTIAEAMGRTNAFRDRDAVVMQQILEFATHDIKSITNYPEAFDKYISQIRRFVAESEDFSPQMKASLDKLYVEADANMRLAETLALHPQQQAYLRIKAQEASLRALMQRTTKEGTDADFTKAMQRLLENEQTLVNFNRQAASNDFLEEMTGLIVRQSAPGPQTFNTTAMNNKVLVTEAMGRALEGTKQLDWSKTVESIAEFQKFWRRAATTNPAFNVRNYFGGVINEMAFGHTGVEIRRNQNHIMRWLDAEARGLPEYIPRNPRDARILKELTERGDFNSMHRTHFGDTAGQVTSGIGENARRSTRGPLTNARNSFRGVRERAAVGFDAFGANVGAATRLSNPFNNPFTTGSIVKQGQQVEPILRGGHIMSRMQRGFSYDDARMSMFEAHFDYSDLGRFDQQARLAMPFWTFRSRNLPLQLHLITHKPGLYGDIARFQRATDDRAELQPDYYDEFFHVVSDNGRVLFTPDLPFNDLIQLTSELRQSVAEGGPLAGGAGFGFTVALNDSSPVIKAMYGMVSQQNPFTGAPLDNPYHELVLPNIPGLSGDDRHAGMLFSILRTSGLLGVRLDSDGAIYMDERIAYGLNQLVPLWRKSSSLAEGEEDRDRRFAQWINFVFGGVKIHGTSEQINGAYTTVREWDAFVEETKLFGG